MHAALWAITGLILMLLGLAGLVILIGLALPRGHTATSRAVVSATPEAVWEALTDYESMPQWRPELTRVEPLADGRRGWIEHSKFGRLPMVIETAEAPRLLVGRIADDKLPFGGTWTYRLEPEGESRTAVSITEDGEVYNPMFRFISRFIMGYNGTMDAYLRNLGRKFGAEVEPEHVAR
ncbi:MAG: SRPBCC family protein [Phycisphaerales bacterium JB039]